MTPGFHHNGKDAIMNQHTNTDQTNMDQSNTFFYDVFDAMVSNAKGASGPAQLAAALRACALAHHAEARYSQHNMARMIQWERQLLRDELKPQSAADEALVDIMAFDYMQLDRVRTMTARLFPPITPASDLGKPWGLPREARAVHIPGCDGPAVPTTGEGWDLPIDDAHKLADCLVQWLGRAQADLAAHKAPVPNPPATTTIEERRPHAILLAAAGPGSCRKLADEAYVAAVLTGQQRCQSRRWQDLVSLLMFALEERMGAGGDDALAVAAKRPQMQQLLWRYETLLAQGIQRQLNRITARR